MTSKSIVQEVIYTYRLLKNITVIAGNSDVITGVLKRNNDVIMM